VVQAWK